MPWTSKFHSHYTHIENILADVNSTSNCDYHLQSFSQELLETGIYCLKRLFNLAVLKLFNMPYSLFNTGVGTEYSTVSYSVGHHDPTVRSLKIYIFYRGIFCAVTLTSALA